MTNVGLAVVILYPERWKDRSLWGLQDKVKYLLLDQNKIGIEKKWAPIFVQKSLPEIWKETAKSRLNTS